MSWIGLAVLVFVVAVVVVAVVFMVSAVFPAPDVIDHSAEEPEAEAEEEPVEPEDGFSVLDELSDWDAVFNDDHTQAVFFDPTCETEVFSKLDDSEEPQVDTDQDSGENTEPANTSGRHSIDLVEGLPFLSLYARLRQEQEEEKTRPFKIGMFTTTLAATVALPVYESLVSDLGEPLWSLVA